MRHLHRKRPPQKSRYSRHYRAPSVKRKTASVIPVRHQVPRIAWRKKASTASRQHRNRFAVC